MEDEFRAETEMKDENGLSEPEAAETDDESFRARVFVLADDNDWRDLATGTFQCLQQVPL